MDDELFPYLDRLLGELQYMHEDLARTIGEYQDVVERARDRGRLDEETIGYLRGVPGARYRVKSEYIRQQWLAFEAEMKRRFPRVDADDEGASGLNPLV